MLTASYKRIDLRQIIAILLEEKKQLDNVISSLEALENRSPVGNAKPASQHRGRRSMSHEERLRVSERMKRYWLSRNARQGEKGGTEKGSKLDYPGEAAQAKGSTPGTW